jgi:hypothetical protein
MKELERFKIEVNLVEYVMSYGYNRLDRNKSCKTCTVLRRREDDGKIAVMRGRDGHWVYYDFRRGEGGSILDFVMQHKGCNLGQARKALRITSHINSLSSPSAPFFEPHPAAKDRQKTARGYADTNLFTKHHVYLAKRGIYLKDVINKRFLGMVRVDQRKNVCFPYLDFDGVAGLERRNFNFKGYTEGGSKGLWRSNLMKDDTRAVICESPIDALSYANVHPDSYDQTRYFATGGQVSRKQWGLLNGLVNKSQNLKMVIVLAFDNDPAGRDYIRQFQVRYPGVEFNLDLPSKQGQDWNDVLLEHVRLRKINLNQPDHR